MKTRAARRHHLTAGLAASVAAAGILALAAGTAAEEAATFQQVPAASIDAAQKAVAERAGAGTLEAWGAGRFEPLGADFTDRLKAALTPEKQRQAAQAVTARYGDFQSMAFHEATTTSKLPGLTIFRFRGTFSKGRPEVRVVVSKAKKVAGLFVLPWSDVIQ